ncbi:AraC family transcriptional regulator [Pricia sp. S334]|uniref:AraC family transcriptional regulator n=1 Tax=Pricia mediterranea TaxID=3076079 RepID=A0ABU3L9T8_9FLAO|nr:AraC family transcriptional regulator [Pricia sp. S334]MDT7830430.1 AraC family transcriptional regulator [Pricia sp. S334]
MQNIYNIATSQPEFKKIEVSSVLFSEYKCLEERSVFKAWSHLNFFVYVIQGKKKWRTLENSYMVHANEALFVKKGANIIHKFFDVQFCALMIFIPDDFIKDLIAEKPKIALGQKRVESDSVIPLKLDKTLSTYFSSLYAYFFNEEKPSPHLMEIKFKELLVNLLSLPINPKIGSYFMDVAQREKPSVEYIMESNFIHNLSLKEFAELTCRSLSTFKRDFKNRYGTSPGRWLTEKRLQHAERLLETTDQKIYEVAFECGFESPSHFTRVFKKKQGTSPLQYKER